MHYEIGRIKIGVNCQLIGVWQKFQEVLEYQPDFEIEILRDEPKIYGFYESPFWKGKVLRIGGDIMLVDEQWKKNIILP